MVTDKACSIALVVPGLCGPAIDAPLEEYLVAETPALDRLLSRSYQSTAAATLDAVLAAFFVPLADAVEPLPVASLTWLADTGESRNDYLLRIDPVHVRADQSCLRLFDAATFSLQPDETAALVVTINTFFGERGWKVQAPHPQRWYLALAEVPDMRTVNPDEIRGEDINDCLPTGPDSREWHVLMNAVQMLLHDHPVNAARVARGELPVNSIWPWGGGILPAIAATAVAQVITDQPVLIGLAQRAGVARRDLPGASGELPGLLQAGLNLVVVDYLEKAARYGDVEAWSEGASQLEQTWCAPVLDLLKRRQLSALDIYPVNGQRFSLQRRHLRHFWKHLRPFTTVCRHV